MNIHEGGLNHTTTMEGFCNYTFMMTITMTFTKSNGKIRLLCKSYILG